MSLINITLDNELFKIYSFYVAVLVFKIFMMAVLSGYQRFTRKVFINPEDAVLVNAKPCFDENVERIRRAHLNDLENILPFFAVSLMYIGTNPSYSFTLFLFRLYTFARFMHSFVYAVVIVRQPARAFFFNIGYFITLYMSVQTILYHMK